MFNTMDPATTIAAKWTMQMKMFTRMNFILDGLNADFQPTFTNDVALAIYNCIKMEETIGQTYDLGGPHTYSYDEVYEHFFNLTEIKPYTVVKKLEEAYQYKNYPWYTSPYRKLFRLWLTPEYITQEAQPLVVNPDNKGYADLNIKPISFGHRAGDLVSEITWLYGSRDETKRETANA